MHVGVTVKLIDYDTHNFERTAVVSIQFCLKKEFVSV